MLWVVVLLEVKECVTSVFIVVIERDQAVIQDIDILDSSKVPLDSDKIAHARGVDCTPDVDLDAVNTMGLALLNCCDGKLSFSPCTAAPMTAIAAFELDLCLVGID